MGIFLNLANSFDAVDRERLLHKLDNVGIRGIVLNRLESYFVDKMQRVCIVNVVNNYRAINYEVHLRPGLSPTLTLIHINDPIHRTNNSKKMCYASDIVLLSAKHWIDKCKLAEIDLSNIKQ